MTEKTIWDEVAMEQQRLVIEVNELIRDRYAKLLWEAKLGALETVKAMITTEHIRSNILRHENNNVHQKKYVT